MMYCFDVDGTICTLTKGKGGYVTAEPIQHIVDKINTLYDQGNIIKIFTARGQATGVSYRALTQKQLENWGVKYHYLIMGKPEADMYVDDKACHPAQLPYMKTPLVFTNGCFDIIHPGHIKLLRIAACYGNVVVGLNSDRSISKIKEGRPVNSEEYRKTVLSSIRYVHEVKLFGEKTPERLIRSLHPDVLFKCADWKEEDIAGAEYVKSYGGRIIRVELEPGFSTTEILERIRK